MQVHAGLLETSNGAAAHANQVAGRAPQPPDTGQGTDIAKEVIAAHGSLRPAREVTFPVLAPTVTSVYT